MRWRLIVILLFAFHLLNAQNPVKEDSGRSVIIGRIILAGNKVTKDRIILRELSLHTGDTVQIEELETILAQQKKRIYNLLLFNEVNIQSIQSNESEIELLIEVQERWYTYPIPIFELSDRNFNEWWENYNHDFSRTNYGIRLYQNNLRGRNETLKLTARFGFSKRFDIYYKIPNLNRSQTQGLILEYRYSEPFNLAYQTNDHILTFLGARKPLRVSNSAAATWIYRNSFYRTHALKAGFLEINASDTIRRLNPAYLSENNSRQFFTSLSYLYNAEHRDVIAYPLKGYQFTAGLTAVGLTAREKIRYVNFNTSFAWHREVGKELFFSFFSSLYVNTNPGQPYAIISGVGYDRQYIRGYETYVIEGPAFALNKVTLKKRILNGYTSFPYSRLTQFSRIPIAIYFKLFSDFGYVDNYPVYQSTQLNTRLSNKPLAGAGFGFDFVTYYDSVIRLEYTFTSQATSGFFLNIRKEF